MAGLKLSNVKSWKTALLISIIIPTSLLTAFTLNNLLNKPITITETTTLEATEWQIERPTYIIKIGNVINASHKNGETSIDSSIFIYSFISKPNEYGSPFVDMQTSINISVGEGFIHLVNVTFWENYEGSQVEFFEDNAWPKYYISLENLFVTRHSDFFWSPGLKAFVELAGVNHPKKVSFGCITHWILRSPKNYTHQLEIRFELVYFNGTAYKKIVQPLLLKVGPDSNNSFETATELSKNQTLKKIYIGGYDENDYYKIYLEKDHSFYVYLEETSSDKANINIYIYDPNGIKRTNQTIELPPYSTSLNLTADKTGYWYIQIELRDDQCFYTLKINTTK